MPFLKALTQSGSKEHDTPSRKRVIILSNYVALTLATANILIFVIIRGNHNIYGFMEMLGGISIFIFPIVLNRWSLTNFSRLYECWLTPAVIILWFMINIMVNLEVVPVSTYDGLRFYLLATSCIPYLIWERKDVALLLFGILPGFIAILFCDPILNYLGVGYYEKGMDDGGYGLTAMRSIVAYIIINGICLSLKIIVDSSDELNEKLFLELAEKNRLLREHSEEKVRLSEHKYRSLFEQASDAIVITDLKGNITDCNPQISQLFGYTRDELLTLNVSDLIDREQLKSRPIAFDQILSGQSFFAERRMIHKNGTAIDIESGVKRFGEENLLAIMRDVSQRKNIERELREAEAKFRNLVEQSLVGVYIMLHGKFAYVNPRFAEIFGYSTEELLNSPGVDTVVHPDHRATVAENVRARLKGDKDSIRYELLGMKKNGEVIWIEAFGTSTLYQGERAIIGTLIDITERKEFEKQQALFASLVNSSEDAIVTTTLDGQITSWNRGATKLFGYPETEVLGKPIALLIPPDHLPEEDQIMAIVHSGQPLEHFETRRRTKNGHTIHISLTVSPVIDADGQIIGVSRIARDITGRKLAEEEKDRAHYLLNERIKELRTLYHSNQILQEKEKSFEDALQEMVNILPLGWQYPDISAARISIGKREFKTSNFATGVHKQVAQFCTPDGESATIELVYLAEMPESIEGPFLAEERNLIDMLAEMLNIYLTRRLEAEALKKSEASLNATINNTTFFVWSVNKKFELQNINTPFRQFIKEKFEADVQEGQSILDLYAQGVRPEEFAPKWLGYYSRALAGESFQLTEEHSGRHFKYSLNTIIENEMVTGVSVFSEETTELKQKERELLEANKQISDLKLMALRAAMNPHFIFNTLNSIQFYIMENDQVNAVSYLSTFSKLIRGILNNSVHHKVKLSDELEMLQHYISLEQMRFENKFDFVLCLPDELDAESMEIPSMLIQPYVENAILHGLYNKIGRGVLKITVEELAQSVAIEIEDDGVGRQAALALRQASVHRHNSHGTALTEERLKLINVKNNVSFEIVDLEREGVPAGTKVKIWIPL